MNIIGAGNRFVAEVDDTNRLKTRTVSKPESVDAVLRADGFLISTGEISLANTAQSAAFLFTNDEDRDLIVVEVGINLSQSAGGADGTVTVTTAVGLGLTMASGSGVEMNNVNLVIGNPGTLSKTSEQGQQGATIAGGLLRNAYYKAGTSFDDAVFAVFPKGSSFGLLVTPPAGNTGMTVNFEVVAYLNKSDS